MVVVLERREEAGPHDVGLGQPRKGRGHSQLGVEKVIEFVGFERIICAVKPSKLNVPKQASKGKIILPGAQ